MPKSKEKKLTFTVDSEGYFEADLVDQEGSVLGIGIYPPAPYKVVLAVNGEMVGLTGKQAVALAMKILKEV